jgi:anti-sigma-K factor RskA
MTVSYVCRRVDEEAIIEPSRQHCADHRHRIIRIDLPEHNLTDLPEWHSRPDPVESFQFQASDRAELRRQFLAPDQYRSLSGEEGGGWRIDSSPIAVQMVAALVKARWTRTVG